VRIWIYLLVAVSVVQAEPLAMLLKKIPKSPLYLSQTAAIEADAAQERAEALPDGWQIGTDLAYADVKDGSDNGAEYGVRLGRDFSLHYPTLHELLRQSRHYARMRKTAVKNRLKAKVWYLYHDYCLTMRAIQAKGELGVVYDEMARHIDKGVRFGEFDASKSIMAHLALENLNLQIAELDSRLKEYEARIEAIVPFDGQFACRLRQPDIDAFFNPERSALWPMLRARTQNAKARMKKAAERVPLLGVEGAYTDELDTRRYTLSLTLPLAFGAKNEAERAAAMQRYEAARRELEAFKNRYAQQTRALKQRLEIYLRHVKAGEKSIALSSDTLIEQSRMRFKAGEESLIGMLKAAETKLQMIETILNLKQSRLEAVYRYLDEYAVDPEGAMQ